MTHGGILKVSRERENRLESLHVLESMSSRNSTQEYYERTLKEAQRYYKAISSAADWAEIKQRPAKTATDRIPQLHVFKRRELNKTIETFRATLIVDCEDTQAALDRWQGIIDNSECRILCKLWIRKL
jgi:hypothetical protein